MSKTYAALRSTIKSGDLLAWSHRGWSTYYDLQIQAVRFFTQSEFSHVGIAWVIGERVFVLEAVSPKIRIYPLSKLLPFYLLPLNAKWSKETEEFALSKIGESYSKLDAIRSFFIETDSSDNNWQCAEFVIETLLQDGINLGPKRIPSSVVNSALRLSSEVYLVET